MEVEFEEPKFTIDPRNSSSSVGPLIKLVMRTGIAKSPAQANLILLGICIFAFILSIIFFKIAFSTSSTIDVPKDAIYVK